MMSPQMRSLLVLALLRVVMEDAKHIRHRHRCECGHSWEHTGQEAASTPNAHTCICGRRVTKPEFDFQQQQQRGEEDGRRT